MKRRIIAAVFTGMLTAALFPAIAHAENPYEAARQFKELASSL